MWLKGKSLLASSLQSTFFEPDVSVNDHQCELRQHRSTGDLLTLVSLPASCIRQPQRNTWCGWVSRKPLINFGTKVHVRVCCGSYQAHQVFSIGELFPSGFRDSFPAIYNDYILLLRFDYNLRFIFNTRRKKLLPQMNNSSPLEFFKIPWFLSVTYLFFIQFLWKLKVGSLLSIIRKHLILTFEMTSKLTSWGVSL